MLPSKFIFREYASVGWFPIAVVAFSLLRLRSSLKCIFFEQNSSGLVAFPLISACAADCSKPAKIGGGSTLLPTRTVPQSF